MSNPVLPAFETLLKDAERTPNQSQIPYRLLFEANPIPMWMVDLTTFRFLAVNDAATCQYGYSSEEFLRMSIADIQPDAHIPDIKEMVAKWCPGIQSPGIRKHKRKDGSTIDVEIVCHDFEFQESKAILCAAYDITERQLSRDMLRDSETKYRALFEHSPDACWLMDETGFLDCNSAALKIFGFSDKADFTDPAAISPSAQSDGTPSRIAAEQRIAAALLNGSQRFEWLHTRSSGEVFPAEVSLSSLTLNGQQLLLASVRDITERKRNEETLLFKNALLEAESETTLDGILVVDEQDHIILVNKQFKAQFGVSDDILKTGDDLLLRKHTRDRIENPDAFIEKIQHLNKHVEENSRDEIRLINGTVFDRYSAPLFDSRGQYRGRIWYHRDITERKAAEAKVEFLAYYDALTGLPNRALLKDQLEKSLVKAQSKGEKVAVMFLDLDRFKVINDSLGHAVGDQLLKALADRLRAYVRGRDTVARVGGDEFVFVLSGIKEAVEVKRIAERIVNAVTTRFSISDHSLNLCGNLGISMYPDDSENADTLVRFADQAMSRSKKNGRNACLFFTKDLNVAAVERLKIQNQLLQALRMGEFYLEYQPQIEVSSGRISGIEALLRWRNHELGLVPPSEFIAIAESTGMILPLGRWVLETACSQVREWLDEGLNAVPVSVNVSAVQFGQTEFADQIREVLAETGLPAEYLELELTESVLVSNEAVMSSILTELIVMGVSLAIDDFGMGYSSLRYLKEFRANRLKIDRSFIRDLKPHNDDAAIISAILGLAKALNVKVVAEGVENEMQVSFLRRHGCNEIQGYYFSEPLTAEEMKEVLKATSKCQPITELYAHNMRPFGELA